MPKSTNKLAFALAVATPMSRRYFVDVFDHLYFTDAAPAGYKLNEIDRYRRETEQQLEALSICDFEYKERALVHSCPPYFGLLPHAGFPAAILFGARTPSTLRLLTLFARQHRQALSVTVSPQPGFRLLPSRVRVQAKDVSTLWDLAGTLGIPLLETPASWLLLSYAKSIRE